jgi:hypothetical protein
MHASDLTPFWRKLRRSIPSMGLSDRFKGHAGLLDHLIGGGQHRFRSGEAERFGGLEVDDELEPCRPSHRKIARLLAAENAACIDAE